jgi:hypothetical protein
MEVRANMVRIVRDRRPLLLINSQGTETCLSCHLIWSVFCDLFYCILISAFCWFLKIWNYYFFDYLGPKYALYLTFLTQLHMTYVLLSVCVYIYIYTHTYTYIHTHTHTHTCIWGLNVLPYSRIIIYLEVNPVSVQTVLCIFSSVVQTRSLL